jgi:hypothetical protein
MKTYIIISVSLQDILSYKNRRNPIEAELLQTGGKKRQMSPEILGASTDKKYLFANCMSPAT